MTRFKRQTVTNTACPIPRHQASGFTLIEVLIALVVLSIGMLGIGALYISSLQSARTAIVRTKAVTFAADLADRIRANRQGLAAYAGAASDRGCADTNTNGATACTPTQMAAHDLFLWRAMLTDPRSGLPDAHATITYSPGIPGLYEIRITWAEAGDSDRQEYVMRVEA